MNWEALGATGEIIGAVAVFVTLAYLAVQVSQNTRAQRNAARLEAMKGMTDWFSMVMARPDRQEVWWRSFVSPDSISEQERLNRGAGARGARASCRKIGDRRRRGVAHGSIARQSSSSTAQNVR